jgi:hypothetical protein
MHTSHAVRTVSRVAPRSHRCWLPGLALLGLCAASLTWLGGCNSNANNAARELRPRVLLRDDAGTPLITSPPRRNQTTALAAAASGAWIPYAVPSFVTVDRSTAWALVHAPDQAVLIVAAGGARPDEAVSDNTPLTTQSNALWWVVEVPNALRQGQSIEIGQRYRAWLLERVPNQPTHGTVGSGTVSIESINEDAVIANLELSAPIGRPTAGRPGVPTVRTNGRVVLVHRVPAAAPSPAIPTNTGAGVPDEPVRLPIWTTLWPDEWKPAGWKYESVPPRAR